MISLIEKCLIEMENKRKGDNYKKTYKKKIKTKFFWLPPEIWGQIFAYISKKKEYLTIQLVSKEFKRIFREFAVRLPVSITNELDDKHHIVTKFPNLQELDFRIIGDPERIASYSFTSLKQLSRLNCNL
jgi:hypothetical protein